MPGKICKGCCLKIGFFKRKFLCQLCSGNFCNACSESVRLNADQLREKLSTLCGFHCLKCVVLEHQSIKREHLFLLHNKQLAEYLNSKNISTVACLEKYDLIDLIIEHAKTNNFLSPEDQEKEFLHQNHLRNLQQAANVRRQQEDALESGSFATPPLHQTSHSEDHQPTTSQSVPTNPIHHSFTYSSFTTASPESSNVPSSNLSAQSHRSNRKWKSMEDVSSIDEIATLSVIELKQVLTANFIDYKGCVEKKELIDKVVMLYNSIEKDKLKTEFQESDREPSNTYERDICKICMDHIIDCVLLNCGHLVACTKCGKRLAECPICRAMVVRVVRIFRV